MFKFILLTLLIVGASMASAATAAADVGGYDETADIVEMAFDAADAFDNADTNDDNAASEETGDVMGYRYNDGDLEDNINIAINAAILDKYGQAVTSERTNSDEVAAKSEHVPQLAKAQKVEKSSKSLAFGANKVDSGDGIKNKSDKVTKVDNGQQVVKATQHVAAPRSENTDTITRFVSQVNADGTYGFDFEQSSGLEFKEFGQGGLYAQGSYQYISPEGEHISVTYKADENGFHPESDSLPTPPPIPAYILKALEYIREHPTAEELADREVRAKQI